jgi:hypothetical protein
VDQFFQTDPLPLFQLVARDGVGDRNGEKHQGKNNHQQVKHG